jgi:hypothetical protein
MVADLTASYVHFATNDGQTHNVGTIVMLVGPVLIGLLAMYFVYNVTAALVNGARMIGRFGMWLFRRPAPVAQVLTPAFAGEADTATIYIAASVA